MDDIRTCPKCGGNPDFYEEIWVNSIEFNISYEQIDRDGAKINGSPTKVKAVCERCGYRWTLRGVSQIDSLFNQK